jgi:hypothetical protein
VVLLPADLAFLAPKHDCCFPSQAAANLSSHLAGSDPFSEDVIIMPYNQSLQGCNDFGHLLVHSPLIKTVEFLMASITDAIYYVFFVPPFNIVMISTIYLPLRSWDVALHAATACKFLAPSLFSVANLLQLFEAL